MMSQHYSLTVPEELALNLLNKKLQHSLSQRTQFTTQHIMEHLGFFFHLQDKYYKLVDGVAMRLMLVL